jgi:hypothetical protein
MEEGGTDRHRHRKTMGGARLSGQRRSQADERRVRERVTQIARESVDQVVVAAVRFIGDDDDIAALG